MIVQDLFEAPQLCPECGGISFSDLILAEKKDACYYKVKASAKVWPSAYASGRLVQCRKKGADNYGNSKNEGVAEGLDPVNKRRLYDLIELYRDATDPSDYYDRDLEDPDEVIAMIRSEFGDKIANQVEAGADKMHYPRHDIQRSDPLGWKKPVDRITKAGKMYKQDSDYMKNTIKARYKNSGKSATEGVAEGDDNFGKPAAMMQPSAAAAKTAQDILQKQADQNVIGMAKVAGAVPAQGVAEVNNEKIGGRYDPEEFDSMVQRLKKLAGVGPMKTVYDPQKRVYRNMPVAQQPDKK